MADPAPNLEANTGSQASPTWTPVMGANHELRWSDQSGQTNIASASWPQMIRPASDTQVSYLYGYTADATGSVVPSNGAFALADYLQCRWNPAGGTFASAPILTCYPSTAHGAITPGDKSILGGDATDTGSSSYVKASAYGFGFQTTVQTPAAAPTGAFPTAADTTAGSVATSTGAWSNGGAKWQDLQGDTDYITSGGSAWDGTAAKYWYFMLALFTGPNMTPGLLQPVCSLKYTWT